MALPWLIGGLAIAGVTALVKKFGEDDDDNYDYESESRRRAVRERAERDRQKNIETETENFLIRGESIGVDLAQSLKDWIKVDFVKSPAFSVKLNCEDENNECTNSTARNITDLLPILVSKNNRFDEIRENLEIYSDSYFVKLKKGDKLVKAEKEIKVIESELQLIAQLKAEISDLKLQQIGLLKAEISRVKRDLPGRIW